ncbi:MAG TPA: YceI family protein [Mucilaginibacter sp.]
MKKTILFLSIFLAVKIASAQYKPVDQGSALTFKIGNFGFDVTGTFGGFQGSINFDPENLVNSHFDVSIDAATVNTDNNLRDKHLKDDSYFDVKDYPRIRFVSDKITAKNGAYNLTGKLTIKDKTKEISFAFTAVPSTDGYAFKGFFKINRKDFNVGGTSTISNELEVTLNVHAVRAQTI